MKLAQAGFGDFLVDTGVSRLKGKRDDNKEVYFVDTICNTNRLTVNSKVQKLK